MVKIKVIRSGKAEYITDFAGNLTWSDNVDSLGMEFSFSRPHSYFDEQFKDYFKVGDTVVLSDGDEILRGIIVKAPIGDSTYTGYDYAWYLNKSETVIQFKKIAASKAITKLCDRYEVPIGSIAIMNTLISKVYKDRSPSDIIRDILSQVTAETGKKYRLEMRKGKLCIIESGAIKLKPTYVDDTGKEVSCTKSAKITGVRSIEEMKNKVIVAGTSEEYTQIKATAKSSASIKKYGLLTVVETADDLTEAKARNIAKNRLKELNKVTVTFTATMMGNSEVRSDRMLYFDRPEVGVKGWYKVKSCSHQVSGGIHTMTCEMEG